MKVILLKHVPKTGNKHDIIEVSDGFALNSLFPKGLAERATAGAIKRVEEMKLGEEAERAVREDLLLKNLKELSDVKVTIAGKANSKGHFFAGIHKEEIISALKEQKQIDMDASHIVLDKALKEIGDHKVEVKVQDKDAYFTVELVALEA
ncbi:MAG: 50S ribosomal protein L9 [bacterium]